MRSIMVGRFFPILSQITINTPIQNSSSSKSPTEFHSTYLKQKKIHSTDLKNAQVRGFKAIILFHPIRKITQDREKSV